MLKRVKNYLKDDTIFKYASNDYNYEDEFYKTKNLKRANSIESNYESDDNMRSTKSIFYGEKQGIKCDLFMTRVEKVINQCSLKKRSFSFDASKTTKNFKNNLWLQS